MECIICSAGNRFMHLPVNEKLGKIMLDTQRRTNRDKQTAKMRKIYRGDVTYEYVLLSPSYLFALEDELEKRGYPELLHNTFSEFEKERERHALYMLLRQGKSASFIENITHGTREETESLLRRLFFKLMAKVR